MSVTNNSSGTGSTTDTRNGSVEFYSTQTRYNEPAFDVDDFGRRVPYNTCDFCGTSTKLDYSKYCSYRCKNDAQMARRLERLKELRNKQCQHCNRSFAAKRTDQKYCSTKCRVAAKRLRDKEVPA